MAAPQTREDDDDAAASLIIFRNDASWAAALDSVALNSLSLAKVPLAR